MPAYPPGFDLKVIRENDQQETDTTENSQICDYVSQTCKVVKVCGECVANCNCLTEEYTEQMFIALKKVEEIPIYEEKYELEEDFEFDSFDEQGITKFRR